MQVSDPQPAVLAPAAGKDELRSSDQKADDRSQSGRRFRGTLERKRGDASAALSDVASAAALAGWFRSEAASGATPMAAPARATAVATAGAVDRILIGPGPPE